MQVDLTPLGARMLFGLPMAELANRVVGLDELLGGDGSPLVERLADAEGWGARIDLLEAVVARRLAEAPPPPTEIQWAWQRLERSGGEASIGDLSEELGWSRRRLGGGFRDQVGVPRKTLARILRFERACARIRRAGNEGWGESPWRAATTTRPTSTAISASSAPRRRPSTWLRGCPTGSGSAADSVAA